MNRKLKAVDFFCGIGGMTFGLESAGIDVLYGIDNDIECKDTYEFNNKSRFLNKDINKFSIQDLEKKYGIIRSDDNMIFIACSPCQFWTKINTNKSKSKKSAHLLERFKLFVDYYNPGFIIIENVPGISSKIKESKLKTFTKFLEKKGYSYDTKIINFVKYGVPQNRKRFLLIASRTFENITVPNENKSGKINVIDYLGIQNGFPKINAGHKDQTEFLHTSANLSTTNLKRIKMLKKPGWDRDKLSPIQRKIFEAICHKTGNFKDVYARMWWNRPAPTITTRFNSFSNGRFGHPEEDRAISLREGATLQTFPKSFIFKSTSQNVIAKQIGNAVPPLGAKVLGEIIIKTYSLKVDK